MKLKHILAAVTMMVSATAFASDDGWYGKVGFDQKDKLNSKTDEYQIGRAHV